jgi:hypothetical protein
MFQTTASQIGLVVTTLICLFAAWAGGREQRTVAAIVMIGWIASAAAEDRSFRNPQYVTLALDGLLTVVFSTLAVRWRATWLMGLAAFQILTTATHFAMILDPRIWPRASKNSNTPTPGTWPTRCRWAAPARPTVARWPR